MWLKESIVTLPLEIVYFVYYKEQAMDLITLELLSDSNIEDVRKIQRDDISEAFVDTADTIIELNQYGIDHN